MAENKTDKTVKGPNLSDIMPGAGIIAQPLADWLKEGEILPTISNIIATPNKSAQTNVAIPMTVAHSLATIALFDLRKRAFTTAYQLHARRAAQAPPRPNRYWSGEYSENVQSTSTAFTKIIPIPIPKHGSNRLL